MKKEDLINLKKQISELSDEEKKQRDLYLRELANGTLQGPPTGYASIDKPWLKYYDKNDIVTDIPKLKAYEYMLLNNAEHLDKTAINFLGKKITYREMIVNVDKIAKALVANGVKEGDVVTVAIANIPENIYLLYAINKIGAIYNVIDPRYTSEEFLREINAVNSKMVICLDMCYENILPILKETKVEKLICLSPIESLPFLNSINKIKNNISGNFYKWNQFIKSGNSISKEVNSSFVANQPIVVVHTGGTTGEPKGVILTNENFVAMAQMHKNGGLDYTINDTFLNVLPPFVAFCLSNGINMPLTLGLEVSIIPKFDVPKFAELLDKYKPNHVLAGPILWEYVIKSNIKDLSYLKTPVSGGDSLNEATEKSINDFFAKHGCKFKVAQGYGMSEVSSAASFSTENSNKLGSVGIPFIKNSISIFDPDDCSEKLYNEEGEIWINTPTMMKEYLNNKKATNDLKYVEKDGKIWIRTGDIGKIDSEGHLYIVGRMKRMIVRNGNKIFPANIESIVLENSDIENCSVVSMHDDVERSVPVIHIIMNEAAKSTREEIVEYIKNKIGTCLPDYNIPVKFVFRSSFPLTKINKIDYKALESEELGNDEIINKKEKALIKNI